ncbi:MAG: hypothetical protein J5693_06220 [Bacteroidales bacterium]|nr:hypothetical protein [Bacteroidales bacterium]
MNRRILTAALLALVSLSAAAQEPNAFRDPLFSKGFAVICPDAAADTVCGALLVDSTATPVWTLRQYNSKFNIAKHEFDNVGNRYFFAAPGNGNLLAKSVTVNPVRGSLKMECNGSAEYKGIRRSYQPWIHMTAGAPTDTVALSRCTSLKLSFNYKISSYEDCMGFLANKGFHAATCRLQLVLRNNNRMSPAYGKMFRLGLILFDNRYIGAACESAFIKKDIIGDGEFAVYPKSSLYMPGSNGRLPKVRQNVEMNVDVLPLVEPALKMAVTEELLPETRTSDWEVVGCDLGWEMTGTYNACLDIKKLQLSPR